MKPPDDARLRHLRDAAERALQLAASTSRQALDDDDVLRLALTKLVEIVGEAAKQITNETKEEHPDVPWSEAARMRDRLVHHYFDIDLDVLWQTLTKDLPMLLEVVPRPS